MITQDFLETLDFIYIFQQGQKWFNQSFLPAFETAVKNKSIDAELIGETYASIADIYDFNGAPLLALANYQKALEFNPTDVDLILDAVLLNEQLGNYAEALEQTKKALELEPDDEELHETEARIEEAIIYTHEPEFTTEHLTWQYCEWLESDNTERLIKFVSVQKSKDTDVLKCLANAYAKINDIDAYKATWSQILQLKEEQVSMTYADWFYMPEAVYNDAAFWNEILTAKAKFETVVLVHHMDFEDKYPNLEAAQLIEFAANYYLGQNDNNTLSKLKKQYPLYKKL